MQNMNVTFLRIKMGIESKKKSVFFPDERDNFPHEERLFPCSQSKSVDNKALLSFFEIKKYYKEGQYENISSQLWQFLHKISIY